MMILIKPVEHTYAITIHRMGAPAPYYAVGLDCITTSTLMGVRVAKLSRDIIIDIINCHSMRPTLYINKIGVMYYMIP